VADLTGHAQDAPVGLDNPPAQREPQPCAQAWRFGRKEGFKDARVEGRRNPRPSVRHCECDPALRGVVLRGADNVPGAWGGTERLLRVGEEVDEHLLQLVRIPPEEGDLVVEVQVHRHVVDPQGIGQELHGLRHQCVERDRHALRRVLAGQGEKLPHQALAACRRLGDLRGRLGQRAIPEVFSQELGLQHNAGEGIV